jgi:hypothetical protein
MQAQKLVKAIQLCRKAVKGNSCMPILNHVHVSANGKLQLTATDLDTSIRITFHEEITAEPFETCLPMNRGRYPSDGPMRYGDLLSGLDDVALSHIGAVINEEGQEQVCQRIKFDSGSFSAELTGMFPCDFPAWIEQEPTAQGEYYGAHVELYQRPLEEYPGRLYHKQCQEREQRFRGVIKMIGASMKRDLSGMRKAVSKPVVKKVVQDPKQEKVKPAIVAPKSTSVAKAIAKPESRELTKQEAGGAWGSKLSTVLRRAWKRQDRPRHINPIADRLVRVASQNIGRGQAFYLSAAYRLLKAR